MSEAFRQFLLKKQAEENAKKQQTAASKIEAVGNSYKQTRDRNPDGSVTLTYDFVVEDANNETFTGEKLQTSFNEIVKVVQDNLDTKGRNSMQANLNANNNKLVNIANPVALLDAVNLQTLQSYITQGSNTLADAGSNSAENNVYLQLPYTLESLADGFVISFIAPFTATVEQFKANQRYEQIGLLNPNETIANALIKPIARAKYTEDDNYTDGIKDNRPSFIQGKRYTLQYRQDLDAWVTHDGNLEGQIITYNKNDTTPAGYIDLAYNYDGYGDVGEFNYIASYQPKLVLSNPDDETSAKVQTSVFGKQEISMLPDHEHDIFGGENGTATPGSIFLGALAEITKKITRSTISKDIAKYIIGDRIKPHTAHKRYLLKI